MYDRFTEEQRDAWDAVYDPMNEEFKKNYPTMTEKELMQLEVPALYAGLPGMYCCRG